MKPCRILFTAAAVFWAFSCKPTQEEVKPEIKIPAESQEVFSSGISFPENQSASVQTTTVSFTASESWSANVTDTKASSWLSVQPSSGGAGTVNMTVTAQPNTVETARSASVTIKCGSFTKSFSVTQAGNPPAVIAVESISLDKTELALVEGEEATLAATVKPENATDNTVIWSTSNAEIATVEGGKVTAVKEGEAVITAAAGEKSATCKVTVSRKVIEVESITLDMAEVNLVEGEEVALVATVNPENATDKTVTWTTSNAEVATVEDGKVTAVKEGTATITAKAGEKEATCKVAVTKKVIPVESVTLNKTTLSLTKGQSETLTATVSPDNATDKTVTWSSSDATIASVDPNGKVTAMKSGTTTITAKAGEKSATCAVTITTPVESVSLDQTSITLEIGKTATLVATINPSDADEKTIQWTTSSASVATVANGVITAEAEGTATITATVGGKSATCVVTVKKKELGGDDPEGFEYGGEEEEW